MKQITYAFDRDTGLVMSRFSEDGHTHGYAFPVLDFEHMKPENNFETRYALENIGTWLPGSYWPALRWTKKIPVELKNRHRAFWGMKELP